jgi:hypothetical protein
MTEGFIFRSEETKNCWQIKVNEQK